MEGMEKNIKSVMQPSESERWKGNMEKQLLLQKSRKLLDTERQVFRESRLSDPRKDNGGLIEDTLGERDNDRVVVPKMHQDEL